MPYQFLAHKNKYFRALQWGRRILTAPTGDDWATLLYYNLPDPDKPFTGYKSMAYPGGKPAYTYETWLRSQTTVNPLRRLPMFLDEFNALIEECEKYLGNPYLWGGKTPPYFDCSGFVGYCYKKVGLLDQSIVSYTETLKAACTKVTEPYYGDLAFWYWGRDENNGVLAHVAIFLGLDGNTSFWALDSARGGVQYRTKTTNDWAFSGFYRIPARGN